MLLEAEDLRVDVDGVPAVEGLSLRLEAGSALVLGAPRALLEAAAGLRPVVRGRLLVRGAVAAEAARANAVALVPIDLAVPAKWSTLEYVAWNARLAGASRREADARAAAAIAKLDLAAATKTRLDRLPTAARRAAAVAAALATGADTILLEDPLADLAEDVASTFARVLAAAVEGRAWIVFAPRVALASPLAVAAGEAAVVSGSRIEAQGSPATLVRARRRFTARIAGDAAAAVPVLAARLAERGGLAEANGAHVTIDLGESLTTAELLGLAAEAKVVFLELLPLARALA